MDEPFDQPTQPNYGQQDYVPERKMFGGRFILKRRIGRGGMGEVWLAADVELGRNVALKFAPAEVANDPKSIAELRREVIAGLELSHPRIARVYDLQVGEGEAAISMELVEGKSLSDLQAETEHGFFEADEIAGWMDDVAEALEYAHTEAKRTHRDVKPKNILVDAKTGRAKLVDFGISKRLSDSFTRSTGRDTSGSLSYMSLQQLRGEMTAAEDDWYSLGATAYELLTGAPPFFQGDVRTQIEQVVPPSMMGRRHELAGELIDSEGEAIPEQWEQWVAGLLAKERPARADWMRKPGAAVAAAPPAMPKVTPPVEEAPVVPSPAPEPVEPAVQASSPRAGLKALVVVLVLAVLGAGGGVLWSMMGQGDAQGDKAARAAVALAAEETREREERLREMEEQAVAEKIAREAELRRMDEEKLQRAVFNQLMDEETARREQAAAEKMRKEEALAAKAAEEEKRKAEELTMENVELLIRGKHPEEEQAKERGKTPKIFITPPGEERGKNFRVVYGGSDGASFRSDPAGDLWANMYKMSGPARLESTGNPRSAADLMWEPIEVRGWMVEYNRGTKNRYIQRNGSSGTVVWSSPIKKQNNVSIRTAATTQAAKLGDVFKGARLEVLNSREDASYRWLEVRMRGWMARTSPKGTVLIQKEQ